MWWRSCRLRSSRTTSTGQLESWITVSAARPSSRPPRSASPVAEHDPAGVEVASLLEDGAGRSGAGGRPDRTLAGHAGPLELADAADERLDLLWAVPDDHWRKRLVNLDMEYANGFSADAG
jgi:hypothetical protein